MDNKKSAWNTKNIGDIQSRDGEATNPDTQTNNSTEFCRSGLRATRGDYNLFLFVPSAYKNLRIKTFLTFK